MYFPFAAVTGYAQMWKDIPKQTSGTSQCLILSKSLSKDLLTACRDHMTVLNILNVTLFSSSVSLYFEQKDV